LAHEIMVGSCVGRVVRLPPNGIVVKFIEQQTVRDLEPLVVRTIPAVEGRYHLARAGRGPRRGRGSDNTKLAFFGRAQGANESSSVKTALLAGYALINVLGNHVTDVVKVVGRADIYLACELMAYECVPETKLNPDTGVRLAGDAPNNQSLRLDDAPILEIGCLINVRFFLGE